MLGAGGAGPKSILFNERLRAGFVEFCPRRQFHLGVCNGCQMVSTLKDLIPGAAHWPQFVRNRSEQFERAWRWCGCRAPRSCWPAWRVRTCPSPSPTVRAGRSSVMRAPGGLRGQRHRGPAFPGQRPLLASRYPANPSSSPAGITGLTSLDGRATIMMPHPERVFRTVQYSWAPPEWGEDGGWLRLFRNAAVAGLAVADRRRPVPVAASLGAGPFLYNDALLTGMQPRPRQSTDMLNKYPLWKYLLVLFCRAGPVLRRAQPVHAGPALPITGRAAPSRSTSRPWAVPWRRWTRPASSTSTRRLMPAGATP